MQRSPSRTSLTSLIRKRGMTGTALTEEKEFRDIYGMDVVEIPTNRPIARKDLQDAVYKTQERKTPCHCGGRQGSPCKGAAGTGWYDYY